MKSEWLYNLKVGDEVVIHGTYQQDCIKKIDRITKTLFIIGHLRIKRSTGSTFKGFRSTSISQATGEKRRQIQRAKERAIILKQIGKTTFSGLSLDKLKEISLVIK